jgi:hypothetical protein
MFKREVFLAPWSERKRPMINAKEVAVENRAEETYYHRTLPVIAEFQVEC